MNIFIQKLADFRLNWEILKSQQQQQQQKKKKKNGTRTISVIVQSVNGHLWCTCCLFALYSLCVLFYLELWDNKDFVTYGNWCLVSRNIHTQKRRPCPARSFWWKTQLILILKLIPSTFNKIVSEAPVVTYPSSKWCLLNELQQSK